LVFSKCYPTTCCIGSARGIPNFIFRLSGFFVSGGVGMLLAHRSEYHFNFNGQCDKFFKFLNSFKGVQKRAKKLTKKLGRQID